MYITRGEDTWSPRTKLNVFLLVSISRRRRFHPDLCNPPSRSMSLGRFFRRSSRRFFPARDRTQDRWIDPCWGFAEDLWIARGRRGGWLDRSRKRDIQTEEISRVWIAPVAGWQRKESSEAAETRGRIKGVRARARAVFHL